MPRLPELTPERLDQRQRAIWDDIVASRGGDPSGPFAAWLHSPELAQRAQSLGAFVRYDTSLAPRLSELAIITTARHWNAATEWAIHMPIAQRSGVDPEVIQAINRRRTPEFTDREQEAVYRFCRDILAAGQAPDPVYRDCESFLGPRGMVELTALVGYYTLVALTLNVFQVPPPSGGHLPLAP